MRTRTPPPPAPEQPRRSLRIGARLLAWARRPRQQVGGNAFDSARLEDLHPPVARPKKSEKLALDQAPDVVNVLAWAAGDAIFSAFKEGTTFLGYPYLSVLAQRSEYRVPVETIASEMTREWIEFNTTDEDQEKNDKIKEIEDALVKLNVRDAFAKWTELDGFFGRAHLYLEIGGEESSDDREELKTSIGDGSDETSKQKVGSKENQRLTAVRAIEPVWTYPTNYESTDPLKADWYRPNTWHVMGKEVHRSRLLTLVSREVPDLLKPTYSFGGLSTSQMLKPYVDNWLRTHQAIADLIHSFSVFVLATQLNGTLEADGQTIEKRVDLFNEMRDNRGAMVIDKDTEDFKNVSTSIAGLEGLQSQVQEHMCLPGDTLIETSRGQIPIRCVVVGDWVMTRNGLAPVAWAGITGYARKLIEINLGPARLRLTECHPIYLSSIDEFVPAKSVRRGDRLLVRQTSPIAMASRFYGAADGGVRPARGITAIARLVGCSTVLSGKRIAAQFRRALISIIETATAPTISCGVLSSQAEGSITAITCSAAGMGLIVTAVWSRICAAFVAVRSRRRIPEGFIAATVVDKPHTGVGVVLSVRNIGTDEPVYNLRIEEGFLPEFFANGSLVHNCAVVQIPVVKMLGIQPQGFNASSEGEIRTFYDGIKAKQERLYRKPLTKIINFVQLSIWGEVDPEITFDFKDLWQLDEAGQVAVEKTKTDIDDANIAMGALEQKEVRQRLARDRKSIYSGIDLSGAPPDLPGEVEPGEEDAPEGGVPNTGATKPNGRVAQFKPRDPGSGLANRIVNRAANFGGAATGGFGGDAGPAKLAKEAVGYEDPATGLDHCAVCGHFLDPDRCQLVIGPVSEDGWCKLFTALPVAAE